ncbi:hypothetical protein D3C78_1243070 [compost metagenome]
MHRAFGKATEQAWFKKINCIRNFRLSVYDHHSWRIFRRRLSADEAGQRAGQQFPQISGNAGRADRQFNGRITKQSRLTPSGSGSRTALQGADRGRLQLAA